MLKGRILLLLVFTLVLAAKSQNPVVQFVLPLGNQDSVSEGVGHFGIALDITNYNTNPTSVDINVLPGGTATHGVNFTYNPVTVTFPANSPYDTIITVTVIDDSIADGDKYFTFKLANPTNNATIGPDSEYVVLMYNDDTVQLNLPGTALTVPKTAGVITFAVDLDPIKSETATNVQVKVVPGATTAVQGVDYLFTDTTIAWNPLTRGVVQVPVTILNDTLIEPNRKIQFQLTDATTGVVLNDSVFTLTILEDDSGPPAVIGFKVRADTIAMHDSLSFNYIYIVGVIGYNPGSDTIYFDVILNSDSSTAVDGNNPPADLQYVTNLLMLLPGDSINTNLGIQLFPDPTISPTKKAVFQFSSVFGNAKISSDSIFTLYITNQNKLIASFLGAGLSYPKSDSLVMIPVVMSTFPQSPVSVDVSLAPGSAVYGKDFTFDDTTVIFPPYSLDTQGVWVHLINNSIYQANKQINFNLSNPTNGVVLDITGYTLTIINDDSLLAIKEISANGNFTLSPNPANNEINIESTEDLVQADILDVLGRVITNNTTLYKGRNNMNVSSLAPGIYIVNVKSNTNITSIPFIKEN